MNADYIYKIINSLENLPYECILFDGPWGVGKTYAVIDALKEYVGTDEYIESVAKEKLGLVHENEILFKEQE